MHICDATGNNKCVQLYVAYGLGFRHEPGGVILDMRVRHVRFHRAPHVSIRAVAACLVGPIAEVHRLPPKVVSVEARGIAPVAMELAKVVSGAHVGAKRCPVVPVFLASRTTSECVTEYQASKRRGREAHWILGYRTYINVESPSPGSSAHFPHCCSTAPGAVALTGPASAPVAPSGPEAQTFAI